MHMADEYAVPCNIRAFIITCTHIKVGVAYIYICAPHLLYIYDFHTSILKNNTYTDCMEYIHQRPYFHHLNIVVLYVLLATGVELDHTVSMAMNVHIASVWTSALI